MAKLLTFTFEYCPGSRFIATMINVYSILESVYLACWSLAVFHARINYIVGVVTVNENRSLYQIVSSSLISAKIALKLRMYEEIRSHCLFLKHFASISMQFS